MCYNAILILPNRYLDLPNLAQLSTLLRFGGYRNLEGKKHTRQCTRLSVLSFQAAERKMLLNKVTNASKSCADLILALSLTSLSLFGLAERVLIPVLPHNALFLDLDLRSPITIHMVCYAPKLLLKTIKEQFVKEVIYIAFGFIQTSD